MRISHRSQPESSTAFRLSKELLEAIDTLCNKLDLTRSQLLRRSVTDFIRANKAESQRGDDDRP